MAHRQPFSANTKAEKRLSVRTGFYGWADKDLRAFCAFRAIRLRPTPSPAETLQCSKHLKTLSAAGGRAETGFLPGIQKPVPARLIRPTVLERDAAIAAE